jgi:hypothetical protein
MNERDRILVARVLGTVFALAGRFLMVLVLIGAGAGSAAPAAEGAYS